MTIVQNLSEIDKLIRCLLLARTATSPISPLKTGALKTGALKTGALK